ncbi:UbiX family flavin prenyltransferase [Schlesneria paludicola]|uniref:UbiX family flavin prenyltransferase n=1 Tax=Schlesneria paludicola TaxID=360056 RepID=UPI00029A710E|nr:flavin prenyltransferase UbiX [Schlesneria paludicola]
MSDIVVAVTGASGSVYATRLIEVLRDSSRTVHLVISPAAVEVFQRELNVTIDLERFDLQQFLSAGSLANSGREKDVPSTIGKVIYHHFRDYSAGIASGSFLTGGMVICPCSMGTLACVAGGHSQNLIHRAADVHLKERRKLIVVPRETPLSLIALDNMKRLVEAGAVVLPAMPGFYHQPQSIQDLVDFVVARICDQLGVKQDLMARWGQSDERNKT